MTPSQAGIAYDLEIVPFSRYGSYFAFSLYEKASQYQVHRPSGAQEHDAIFLRTVQAGALRSTLLRIELREADRSVPFRVLADPSRLRIERCDDPEQFAEFCLDAETVFARTSQTSLRFVALTEDSPYDTIFRTSDDRITFISYLASLKLDFEATLGTLGLDAPWEGARVEHAVIDLHPDPTTRHGECRIEGYVSTPILSSPKTFDDVAASAAEEYHAWSTASLKVPEDYEHIRALATYITWSCMVRPRGFLTRPAMFMSKNWMSRIWNWDNCFNALAHINQDAQLAWDQLMLFVDNQGPDGALPDHVIDSSRSFRFYKPPVHGWTLRRLMERSSFIDSSRLNEIYEPLCRWTDWWFMHRDDDRDGIPQYNHGNESGWDNGTVFNEGVPIESPDLSSYLVVQMDVLAVVAGRLGRTDEQAKWTARADQLLDAMVKHFWDGQQFRACKNGSHEVPAGDSLINFLPIVLGRRMPPDIKTRVVEGLQRFLTRFGPATETTDSPLYEPDGYWRGPIWPPSTILIVDGLLDCGEMAMAHDIMRRFCDLVVTGGMAECFDAVTGEGLRDRGYTWTASVFLLFANQLISNTVD